MNCVDVVLIMWIVWIVWIVEHIVHGFSIIFYFHLKQVPITCLWVLNELDREISKIK